MSQEMSELIEEIYNLLISEIKETSILPNYSKSILKKALQNASEETYSCLAKGEIIDNKDTISASLISSTKTFLKFFKMVEYNPCIIINKINIDIKNEEDKILIGLAMPMTPNDDDFKKIETDNGFLYVIKEDSIEKCIDSYKEILSKFKKGDTNIICFPELSGINNENLRTFISEYSTSNMMCIISGSYHDIENKSNVCEIFIPNNTSYKQNKIFPSEKYDEGIYSEKLFEKIYLFITNSFSFLILICIDSERKAILNVIHDIVDSGLGVDLVFNPSFTNAIKRVETNSLITSLEYFYIPIFCNKIIESAIYCPLYDLKEKDYKLFEMKNDLIQIFPLSMTIIKQIKEKREQEHRRILTSYK